ncbi:DUF4056 domain-containing protein [Shewanella goraebulensis]|uniref:DUF4056 domain-containing protein n=1 Tax=Shewanella goraebulensis TaxID=3050637 RepID=UPI002551BD7B|nr:DUF4056 domain-containing protein [Shewanella goraebulensis]
MMCNYQQTALMGTILLTTLLAGCSTSEWQVSATPNESAVVAALDSQPDPALLRDISLPLNAPITLPTSVRPCCAFGSGQKVKLGAMTIPFYRHANTISLEDLGAHAYEAGSFSHQKSAPDEGRSGENNGIIYTRKGGFIDLAHVRDTADNAVALFYQIHPRLGEPLSISLPFEIGPRTIEIEAFKVGHLTAAQRWELAAAMAVRLAYSMAEAHEIAQYHGYRSFAPWTEDVSAYSPEDLYSNMLGSKIALAVLTNNLAMTRQQYNYHMTSWISATLAWLEPVSATETDALFDVIDGYWWDANEPMPNKFMLLKRHYELGDKQSPYLVPKDMAIKSNNWSALEHIYHSDKAAHDLTLANNVHGIVIDDVAKQWLYVDAKFEASFNHIPESLWRDGFTQQVFFELSQYNQILDEQMLQDHLSQRPQLPLAKEQSTQGQL